MAVKLAFSMRAPILPIATSAGNTVIRIPVEGHEVVAGSKHGRRYLRAVSFVLDISWAARPIIARHL
jgi:hypothetical protein